MQDNILSEQCQIAHTHAQAQVCNEPKPFEQLHETIYRIKS